ncbi:LysR family transcriptional regulator [Sodalis sp. dw_96]|uniref:LysR family transcriptional regulator n=1 Tax=Sodalis sp. dw_96 TaxID=2719794 RepID=UPI001BD5A6C3|nr:LysR family transcriptional regulator [Sodalis sp. dw_96]
MNIKQLQTIIITADTGNVGQAAKLLGITQPAVSQQMHSLETELGFRLFQREGRGMVLTAAGRAFLPQARKSVQAAEEAIQAGERANRGETGRLLVGYCHSSLLEPELPELIRSFSLQWPDIRIEMQDLTVQQQVEYLCLNRLDLAFARTPIGQGENQEKLRVQPFSCARLEVVLPVDHPLAGRQEIDVCSLRDERFLLLNEPDGVGLRNRILDACHLAGFEPLAENASTNMTSIISMIAAGLGITLAPSHLSGLNMPGVIFRPLTSAAALSELALISRLDETSGIILRFVDQVWARQFASPEPLRTP